LRISSLIADALLLAPARTVCGQMSPKESI